MKRRLGLLLALGVFEASACGGKAGSAPPAQAPGGEAAPPGYSGPADSEKAEEQQGGEGAGEFAQPPGSTDVKPTGADKASRTITTVSEAQAAFERDLDAVTSALATAKACDRACKAFGSMDRSSQRICELNGPGDPDERCKKAKQRLDAARDKVKRACAGCAD